ncbi:Kinetochore interacting protein 2 [Trypanosoma cruzi]|nr:Kinetochore interacting protein 2 [Trypanosoma cruzi]
MESIPPKTRVPEDWIHPALKRQLMDRGRLSSSPKDRLELLERQRTEMESAAVRRKQLLEEKERHLEDLDRRRQRIAEEVKEEERRLMNLRHVHERVGDQLIVQKTIGRQEFQTVPGVEGLQSSSCALRVTGIIGWGEIMSCFTADEETRERFFSKYAPLFTVNEGGSMPLKEVTEPVFFDEMCLMETEGNRCMNSACPYWHRDQLEHAKLGCMGLFARAATCIKGHSSICDAASMFSRFYALIEEATDLADVVRIQRDLINHVANLGWAAAILEDEESPTWEAPLLPRPIMSLEHVASLLRDSREKTLWGHIIHSKADVVLQATALFKQHADSFSWRCLMRVAGTTIDRLLWLATRGVALFPTSPFIRLSYLVALMKSGCSISDCVEVCLSSAQLISDQAAIAIFSPQETEWCEVAARYVAYMIAISCIHVARTDPEAAAGLLDAVLELPGRICLLPLALQNLNLFLVVLRKTRRLDGASALPLASISDVSFTLGDGFPCFPDNECGQLLSRHLGLIDLCVSAGIDGSLTERMRSSVHLSLMHALSSDAQLVDQILTKSPMHSALGLAEVWVGYLRLVEQRDGTLSLISLVQSLLDSCQSPLLMVHLVRFLQVHDENVETVIDNFLEDFAKNRGILLEKVPLMASTDSPGLPVDEWIPIVILYSLRLRLRERLELLLSVPLDLYCDVVELVVLLWLETIQVALLLRDDDVFRQCARQGLLLLHEPFLHYFSPVDWDFDEMVSYAHVASLMVYRAIPVLLGTSYQVTAHYRGILLELSAELHVVHPNLLSTE